MSLLKISNLEVAYSNIMALRGVSIQVEEGEIVAVIGANGAGKTTLLKAISGVIPKKNGTIEFRGKNITHLAYHKIVENGLIHVPEGRQIFGEMTVLENLKIGAFANNGKYIREDLDKIFTIFPVLSMRKSQKGGSLSGGEQQMLALARGLMARPKLILLDEPSMGIAPILVEQIYDLLLKINNEGITIVLIEQDAMSALEISSRAYVLESGLMAMSGKSNDLINDKRVQQIYLGG